MKVIFLDYDGVIRLPPDGDWVCQPASEYCQARMKMLAFVCRDYDAKIVISSDWRHMESEEVNRHNLAPYLTPFLHSDWRTTVTGRRWNEVQEWLTRHPKVGSYSILEDFEPHFEGCPPEMLARIVWCNNRHGLVPSLVGRLITTLNK